MKKACGKERRTGAREDGLTLVEMAASLTLFVILLGAVFNVSVETSRFLSDSELSVSVDAEAHRAFLALHRELRESGWSERTTEEGTRRYPEVRGSGTELYFRVPVDIDGNGKPYDGTTGEIEWSGVHAVKRDSTTSNLFVYDGSTPIVTLGRYVKSVGFATYVEDVSLGLREVRVTITVEKDARDGTRRSHAVSGIVVMRN